MNKRELIKFLESFDDEMEILINTDDGFDKDLACPVKCFNYRMTIDGYGVAVLSADTWNDKDLRIE